MLRHGLRSDGEPNFWPGFQAQVLLNPGWLDDIYLEFSGFQLSTYLDVAMYTIHVNP